MMLQSKGYSHTWYKRSILEVISQPAGVANFMMRESLEKLRKIFTSVGSNSLCVPHVFKLQFIQCLSIVS